MKKRVLAVSEHDLDSKGGIQHVMHSIETRLGNEFDFDAVSFKKMSIEDRNQFPGYRKIFCIDCDSSNWISRVIENVFRPLKLYIKAYSIIKNGNYDSIHVHDTLKGGWFLYISKKFNVPVRVMHCHNPEVRDPENVFKRKYNTIMRKIVNECSNVKIGCSVDACKSIFGDDSSYFVVNNETDFNDFNPDRYRSLSKSPVSFVHVGRFTFQKNHEFLINVFKIVHDHYPNADLHLVGWGLYEEEIRKQISFLNLEDSVTIYPGNSNIAQIMWKSQFMIFPSRYEGLGRVLIEAQSMQVMCFASDCIPRETNLGLCDYLPLDEGVEYWAEHIIEFIENNRILSRNLDSQKLATFDIDNIIEIYASIYRGEKFQTVSQHYRRR